MSVVKAESVRLRPKLPPPAVYEQEYDFWPWGSLLQRAANWVSEIVPAGGLVFDYMCGTGYLLHLVRQQRPDLTLRGWDISREYIEYGRHRYTEIDLHVGDVLSLAAQESADLVLCTAGIHHLTRDEQSTFISNVRRTLAADGRFVVGEEVLPRYSTPSERRHSVLALHQALLKYATDANCPDTVLEAACAVLENDLLQRGEYKLSFTELVELVRPVFDIRRNEFVWTAPKEDPFGDVLLLCVGRSET